MKKFTKSLWAFLLVAMLVIGCLPASVFAADAETYSVSSTADLSAACTAIANAGSGDFVISLDADISASSMSFAAPVNVAVIGNGHTITGMNTIHVSNGATLTLGKADGSDTLTVVGVTNNDNPGIVIVKTSSTVNMYDGVTLKDHKGSNYFGGGVTVQGGTFNMYGGSIENCGINGGSVCYGGGVAVVYGGLFNMYGGTISNCYAESSYVDAYDSRCLTAMGGGVFCAGGSSFNMVDGNIIGNKAKNIGGGIAVVSMSEELSSGIGYLKSAVSIEDGIISGNTADKGAGVAASAYFYGYASGCCAQTPGVGTVSTPGLYINGGTIGGNTADSLGGGLLIAMIRPTATVSVNNATISNNSAVDGAGVFNYGYWTKATFDSDTITGNTASEYGGGFAVDSNQGAGTVFTNTVIANNLADAGASDVYIYDSVVKLNGADVPGTTYTGMPADLTGEPTANWYVDNVDDRFADQDEASREVYSGYADIARSNEDIMLIAAPVPGLDKITITKDFIVAEGYDNAGDKIADTTGLMDAAIDPTFVIAPYKSFNRQVGKTDIPEITPNTYTIAVSEGEESVDVALPSYISAGVGDYWYTVTESTSDAAGVTYDATNPRYLHVQVMWTDDTHTATTVKAYLHATAVEDDGSYINAADDKATGFTNEYGAGDLSVTKTLEGNMTDRNKFFKVTVTFTAPAGKTVQSDITYNGGWADEDGTTAYADAVIPAGWTGSKTVEVYLKGDSTVNFTNIPDGVTYTVAEADYSADGYTATYTVDSTASADGDTASADGVSGKIADSKDSVTVNNKKDSNVDVGVILSRTAFVALSLIAILFIALLVMKKRKNIIDED